MSFYLRNTTLRTSGSLLLRSSRLQPRQANIIVHYSILASNSQLHRKAKSGTLLLSTSARSFSWSPSASSPAIVPKTIPPPENLSVSESIEAQTNAPIGTLSSTPSQSIHSVDLSASTTSSTQDILSAVNGDHLGDLAALGLGGKSPIGIFQTLLEQFHVTLDLPWWGSIVLLAAITRFALFPLQLRLAANNSRLTLAAPKMKAIAAELQKAKEEEDRAALMAASSKMRAVYAESGANPLKSFLGPLVQVPVALSMFFAIRRMCNLPVEGLKTGGTQWFVDLTTADPYYILPVLSTAAMMSMLKMSTKDAPQNAASGHMQNFFIVLSAISFPVMAAFPSGLLVYFVANGVLLAVQAAVMRIPAVRSFAGIISPPPPEGTVEKRPNLIESAQAVVKYFSDAKREAMESGAAAASQKYGNQRREIEHLVKMKKAQQSKSGRSKEQHSA